MLLVKITLGALAMAAPLTPTALAATEDGPAKPAALTKAQVEDGRQLFKTWGCGGCHTLTDADGYGDNAPALDGNTTIDHKLMVDRITNGTGPMPGFSGQVEDADIDLLASYVLQVKK